MAKIVFQKEEFEKYFKANKETLDKINMFGVPAELREGEVELEIFPNRPDLLSLQGFARAFKSYLGKDSGLNKYKINKSGFKLIVEKSLPKEWPYAIACIVKGLKLDDAKIKEIIQIQEKLGSTLLRNRKKGGIGLYPLQKISFPIRFKGEEPEKIKFRPLEYKMEISGREILSKHPAGREYADIVKSWEKFPIFIDDKNKIMSMPPIINSHELGKVETGTKEVFIEATGNNLEALKFAINIISTSLSDMGGKIYSMECIQQDKKTENIPDLTPKKVKISLESANKVLGLTLNEKDLEKLLPKMGYDYRSPFVFIPAWRQDILHERDIIEDIAIAYGYDNLIPQIPTLSGEAEEHEKSRKSEKIAKILSGLGLLEISSYHLVKKEEIKNLEALELENSKTEYKFLRPNLLIPALRILAENKDNEYPQKIFELGTVFTQDNTGKSETGIKEEDRVIIACSPANFTEMKQIINYLARSLSLSCETKEHNHHGFIEGRTAQVIISGKKAGYIGEVHPQTLIDWNIKMPVGVIELSLDDFLL